MGMKEQMKRAPISRCTCGHLGDGGGEGTQHGGLLGHGMCTVPGCDCVKFRWAGFLPGHSAVDLLIKRGPQVPKYKLEVRHPELGWQVSELAKDADRAKSLFDVYAATYPEFSWKLLEISGNQSWAVIGDHVGTYDYSKVRV